MGILITTLLEPCEEIQISFIPFPLGPLNLATYQLLLVKFANGLDRTQVAAKNICEPALSMLALREIVQICLLHRLSISIFESSYSSFRLRNALLSLKINENF